ncbi:hypothetical protein M0R45_018109 [Rubus argutus]|uniref:Uncharacterized protein n=1 Tax=Rubus argutus TaxID=59490 RepID=A0AAW1X378_RUBAR
MAAGRSLLHNHRMASIPIPSSLTASQARASSQRSQTLLALEALSLTAAAIKLQFTNFIITMPPRHSFRDRSQSQVHDSLVFLTAITAPCTSLAVTMEPSPPRSAFTKFRMTQ